MCYHRSNHSLVFVRASKGLKRAYSLSLVVVVLVGLGSRPVLLVQDVRHKKTSIASAGSLSLGSSLSSSFPLFLGVLRSLS